MGPTYSTLKTCFFLLPINSQLICTYSTNKCRQNFCWQYVCTLFTVAVSKFLHIHKYVLVHAKHSDHPMLNVIVKGCIKENDCISLFLPKSFKVDLHNFEDAQQAQTSDGIYHMNNLYSQNQEAPAHLCKSKPKNNRCLTIITCKAKKNRTSYLL